MEGMACSPARSPRPRHIDNISSSYHSFRFRHSRLLATILLSLTSPTSTQLLSLPRFAFPLTGHSFKMVRMSVLADALKAIHNGAVAFPAVSLHVRMIDEIACQISRLLHPSFPSQPRSAASARF